VVVEGAMTDPLQTRANTLEQCMILFRELKLMHETNARPPILMRRLHALEKLIKQEHAAISRINIYREMRGGVQPIGVHEMFKPGDTL
jgi:hypothetical protein